MLSSVEIRRRIESGMITCEPLPFGWDLGNKPNYIMPLILDWAKRLECEGGLFDLTCDQFFSFDTGEMPVIGLEQRITPKIKPINWVRNTNKKGEATIPNIRLGPGEYVLFTTRERFNTPPDVSVRLERKSTLHRCGIDCPVETDPGIEFPVLFQDVEYPAMFQYGVNVLMSPAHASFHGVLTLGLYVCGNLPVIIEYGARLLTSSYWPVDAASTTQYNGPHQGGVITSNGKKIAPC